ncbi:MAG: hypothetical protein R3C05_00420 [Pirellulaceae bacterium]
MARKKAPRCPAFRLSARVRRRTAERSDGVGNASLANNLIHRTGQARWGLMRTTLVNQMWGKPT